MDGDKITFLYEGDTPPAGFVAAPRKVLRTTTGAVQLYFEGDTPPVITYATDELFVSLRAARDARLTATDKYLLADYPISAENLALVKAYRAALRALPEQTGAPWGGGGDGTPWPQEPKV